MFRFATWAIKFLDSPDMFVTSAMIAQANVLRRSAGTSIHLQGQGATREKPCATIQNRFATSKMTPKCCKKKCGGRKARLFKTVH